MGTLHTIAQDLVFAVRSFRRQPAATLVALGALALGIGATAAVFSAVDAALLRPVPFAEPDELVFVWAQDTESGQERSVSYPDFEDWRAGGDAALAGLVAVGEDDFTIGAAGGDSRVAAAGGRAAAERVAGEWISPGYFDLLGIPFAAGGPFPTVEPGAASEPIAVLGHALWQSRFGGRLDVVGAPVRLNGVAFTVVGVAAEGFRGVGSEADLWVPIGLFDRAHPELARYDVLGTRSTRWHSAIGRLRDGASVERAEAALSAVAARLRSEHPDSNETIGVRLVTARDQLAGHLRSPLGVLTAGAGLVLLIACANLAHVLLARNAARHSELAVRSALGAGRGRLIRQLLTETMLLATAGGALGLGLAYWGIDLLAAAAASELPGYAEITLDLRVIGVAWAATVVSGLVAGLAPAALAARSPRAAGGVGALAGSARGGERRISRLLSVLVAAETACAVGLLVAAGLMLASSSRALRFEPGFAATDALTARFALPADPERQEPLSRGLLDRIAALPEIESVARTSHVFFGDGYLTREITAETERGTAEDTATVLWVDPEFFSVLELPLRAGRAFRVTDREQAPAVAIVNRTFARRHWPDGRAVGRYLRFGAADDPEAEPVEIVGVAADVRQSLRSAPDGPAAQVYRPVEQGGAWARRLVLRTRGERSDLAGALARAAVEVDPDLPIWDVSALSSLVRARSSETRLLSTLLSAFAVLAALLAATGVYGILAFAAVRRRREIGVRLALGARRWESERRVVAGGLGAAALGALLGMVGAWVGAGALASVVYEVQPREPKIFAAAAIVALLAIAAGAWLPARQAARLDPGSILRES